MVLMTGMPLERCVRRLWGDANSWLGSHKCEPCAITNFEPSCFEHTSFPMLMLPLSLNSSESRKGIGTSVRWPGLRWPCPPSFFRRSICILHHHAKLLADLFDPVVRGRGTFSMSASSPPNPQQANRRSANCAKCSGQCPSGLAGSVWGCQAWPLRLLSWPREEALVPWF